MIKRTLAICCCLATFLSTYAETIADKKFFYSKEDEYTNSYMRKYSLSLPDNISSDIKNSILPNLYRIMGVNPSNVSDCSSNFDAETMKPMTDKKMLLKYNALYESDDIAMENWYDTSNGNVITNTPTLLVVEVDNDGYWGGAHGGHSKRYLNWNPAENRKITLDDYVKTPAARARLRNLLYSKAKKSLGSEINGSSKNFPISETFYVNSKGLTFVYDEYEIACYAAGMPTFTVTFSELNGSGNRSTPVKKSTTKKATTKKRR